MLSSRILHHTMGSGTGTFLLNDFSIFSLFTVIKLSHIICLSLLIFFEHFTLFDLVQRSAQCLTKYVILAVITVSSRMYIHCFSLDHPFPVRAFSRAVATPLESVPFSRAVATPSSQCRWRETRAWTRGIVGAIIPRDFRDHATRFSTSGNVFKSFGMN